MKHFSFFFIAFLTISLSIFARPKVAPQVSDREIWASLLYQMAKPVLEPLSEGRLQQIMTYENGNLELSPTWDGRNIKVTYMEAFGRLMAGAAPWLSLPDDSISTKQGLQPTAESILRHQLREWAIKSYINAVDPDSPDYLGWTCAGQTLVDAAYLVESFFRGWDALWKPLPLLTKLRYVKEMQQLHRYDPPYNNWLLFVAMEECFLMKVQAELQQTNFDTADPAITNLLHEIGYGDHNLYDSYRIKLALSKVEEWYIGDGWYADGPSFAFDYYNSYVIHPMYYECLKTIVEVDPKATYLVRTLDPITYEQLPPERRLQEVTLRMQKYASILERYISPEGTYPVYGRSIPYRTAVLQPLALLAWEHNLPQGLTNGQVRASITAVIKKMFLSGANNFNNGGFLTIGFVGSHPNVADIYTNNGSLYMATLAFLPLGLSADDPFWTAPAEKWTSKKAWEGDDFPKDHKWQINSQKLYWE